MNPSRYQHAIDAYSFFRDTGHFLDEADPPCPLADRNMIGTPIRYCGRIYVIEGVNYLGDYDVIRYEAKRKVWQRTSIQPDPLPSSNVRHWEVVGLWHKKRLQRAIINAERLHPHSQIRSKSARAWRRARAYRGVLRRFFRRIQARARTTPRRIG